MSSLSVKQDNHPSATGSRYRRKVEEQIRAVLDNDHYQKVRDKPVIISALAAIPKWGSNKIRVIHDASRLAGHGLNNGAVNDHFSLTTVQRVAELIERGDYLVKVDLTVAYRSVKVHPDDYKLMGLAWLFEGDSEESVMVDIHLPFGARLSAGIFIALTQAVTRIMRSGNSVLS